MPRSRAVLLVVALLFVSNACASNRYVTNRDGRIFDVTLVNSCSPYTVRVWIDDEWQNRRKIDVKARVVGTRPQTFPIPEGRHFYHAEWGVPGGTEIREGSFNVSGSGRMQIC
jgi:hypothetical protein